MRERHLCVVNNQSSLLVTIWGFTAESPAHYQRPAHHHRAWESVRQGLGGLDGGWAGMLRPEQFIVPPELPSIDDTLHLVH